MDMHDMSYFPARLAGKPASCTVMYTTVKVISIPPAVESITEKRRPQTLISEVWYIHHVLPQFFPALRQARVSTILFNFASSTQVPLSVGSSVDQLPPFKVLQLSCSDIVECQRHDLLFSLALVGCERSPLVLAAERRSFAWSRRSRG